MDRWGFVPPSCAPSREQRLLPLTPSLALLAVWVGRSVLTRPSGAPVPGPVAAWPLLRAALTRRRAGRVSLDERPRLANP
ncbi:hypothetical protein WMF45_29810 [Sorangium sp. So ce448]|uniref:hypothetical protein n=1 Tax=Sorangium sp. So ce448 TaxID=3133314 RepID=UPI003F602ACF